MHVSDVQSLACRPPIDIAFISVKSYDTEWATMLIRQYLAPDGYVVSLLENCINEERIAGIVGWSHRRRHRLDDLGGHARGGQGDAHGAEDGRPPHPCSAPGVHGRLSRRIEGSSSCSPWSTRPSPPPTCGASVGPSSY